MSLHSVTTFVQLPSNTIQQANELFTALAKIIFKAKPDTITEQAL